MSFAISKTASDLDILVSLLLGICFENLISSNLDPGRKRGEPNISRIRKFVGENRAWRNTSETDAERQCLNCETGGDNCR